MIYSSFIFKLFLFWYAPFGYLYFSVFQPPFDQVDIKLYHIKQYSGIRTHVLLNAKGECHQLIFKKCFIFFQTKKSMEFVAREVVNQTTALLSLEVTQTPVSSFADKRRAKISKTNAAKLQNVFTFNHQLNPKIKR